MKKSLSVIFSILILAALALGFYWLASEIWGQLKLLNPEVLIAIFSASTTVLVATLTVVVGKQIERKKEIEAHYREKKTEIYDSFLNEFFKLFYSVNDEQNIESDELANFLKEWQRKMILWGGQDVLLMYVDWLKNLKSGEPTIKTMLMMENFFLEIRKDLGHRNTKIKKGTFIYLILQNPELLLALEKKNQNLTLADVAEIENELKE